MVVPEDVNQQLAELSQTLVMDEPLEESLRRVAHLVVSAIPSCDSCSVSLATNGKVYTRMATDELAERIDEIQYSTGEGPCLEAIRTGELVRIGALAEEARWPEFVERARHEPVRSVCSIPLVVRGRTVGAFNLYATRTRFDDSETAICGAVATQAAVVLANAQAYQQARDLAGHLEQALQSRDVIGQAKGIIMEREKVTAERAFEILRKASQERNVKLRDVADRVVLTGTWVDS